VISYDRIPNERAESAVGRELRCEGWMRLLLACERWRGTYRLRLHSRCEQAPSLISTKGGELLRVPHAVLRAWRRRGWIEAIGRGKHGEEWAVTDAGELASEHVTGPVDGLSDR